MSAQPDTCHLAFIHAHCPRSRTLMGDFARMVSHTGAVLDADNNGRLAVAVPDKIAAAEAVL